MMKYLCFLLLLIPAYPLHAQDAAALAASVKAKLEQVKDYEASGRMVTAISFMKVPASAVTVYYKQPDKFRIKKKDGIAITPRGGVSINLSSLFGGDQYTAVWAGKVNLRGKQLAVLKLLPLAAGSEIVVSTLYVDEKELLILKAEATTRSSGTYQMEMDYGSYAAYGLPDRVSFLFDTKDYKLPKGLAFDYDAGTPPAGETGKPQSTQGRVEITYTHYQINKGISDSVFN